jgi:cell division protein FtsW
MLMATLGLMLFSIAFVYSASASIAEHRFGDYDKLFLNHTLRVLGGLLALIIFMKIDYHVWLKLSKPIMFATIIPLLLVFLISSPINGAYRWIYIGSINFQPSELAKFALVIHFAALLTQRQEVIKDFKLGLLPLLVWSFIVCLLIAIQPNFSSAMVIFIISIAMMFIGNVKGKHLSIIGIIAFIGLIGYAVSASYRMQRIINYVSMASGSNDNNEAAFQSQQAIIAFGSGGIFGLGPGQSRQSLLFLPEAYGDFIFSIIGEEYGFIGTFLIVVVFMIMAWRGIKIARNAPDNFGYFLAFGIIFTFILYAFVSAAVNTGLLPTTGLPMPFVSYGGTAIIFYCIAMGILLNISSHSVKDRGTNQNFT